MSDIAPVLVKAFGWDESLHPRHAAGDPQGGQFAPSRGMSAATVEGVEPDDAVDKAAKSWFRDTLTRKAANFRAIWGQSLDYLKDPKLMQAKREELAKWTVEGMFSFDSQTPGLGTLASEMKNYVASHLSHKGDQFSYDYANQRIQAWATSSSMGDSLYTQRAAAREFGTPVSAWLQGEFKDKYGPNGAGAEVQTHQEFEARRRFLRNMYNRTQESLKDFPDYVTLYRGSSNNQVGKVNPTKEKIEVELRSNPLSSWSLSPEVAQRFGGGRVFKMRVHKSRILSTPLTGFGCLDEQEFVVIGHKGDHALAL